MTPLEIGLSVALLLAVIAAVTIVWAARSRFRAAECVIRTGGDRLDYEKDRRMAAQKKAALAFVRSLELEAQLEHASASASAASAAAAAAQSKQQHWLGVGYSAKNEGVAGVMRALQRTIGTFQTKTCAASRAAFAQQKAAVLEQLRQLSSTGPIKCADVTSAVAAWSPIAEQGLRDAMPPGVDASAIVADVADVWAQVSKQVCDAQGVVNADKLSVFMDAVFDAICGGGK